MEAGRAGQGDRQCLGTPFCWHSVSTTERPSAEVAVWAGGWGQVSRDPPRPRLVIMQV